MVEKLSGCKGDPQKGLEFKADKECRATNDLNVAVKTDLAVESEGTSYQPKRYSWPLGDCDCDESLSAAIPLETIRKQSLHGGNIRIEWERNQNIDKNKEQSFVLNRSRKSLDNGAESSSKRANEEVENQKDVEAKRPCVES